MQAAFHGFRLTNTTQPVASIVAAVKHSQRGKLHTPGQVNERADTVGVRSIGEGLAVLAPVRC